MSKISKNYKKTNASTAGTIKCKVKRLSLNFSKEPRVIAKAQYIKNFLFSVDFIAFITRYSHHTPPRNSPKWYADEKLKVSIKL